MILMTLWKGTRLENPTTFQAAQLLFNFSSSRSTTKVSAPERSHHLTNGVANGAVASSSTVAPKKPPTVKIPGVSTATNGTSPASARPSRSAKKAATLKIANNITDLNGLGELSALSAEEQGTGEAPKKRQKAPKKEKAEKKVAQSASARDLRSTSRRDSVSSGSVIEPKTAPVLRLHIDDSHLGESSSASTTGKQKFRTIVVKHEEIDTPLSFSASGSDQASSSTAVSQATPRRRQSRRSLKTTEDTAKADENAGKEKRGRKRKIRDDDSVETAPPTKPTTAASDQAVTQGHR
ncbi:hypothetical protein FA13DRAFT_1220759 [Coprinellus micaceus]|uniref:Uncharacterized protein n=1 Tax=Coprinellus micaceus TaxID=71717 RepID=A0A4Y7TPA2_COPMI|nr:hypothetical protein FA13DRAFT_1220759 [Coprinellus micaceus]